MSVSLVQVSSLDGTWVIDKQLSHWSNGLFPYDSINLSVSLRVKNGHLFYHSMNQTSPDASPVHFQFDIPLDNTSHPFTSSKRFTHLQGRLLPDNSLEILKLKDGKIVIAEIWRRDDQKLLFRWGVSCVASNGPKAYTEYFRKNNISGDQDRAVCF